MRCRRGPGGLGRTPERREWEARGPALGVGSLVAAVGHRGLAGVGKDCVAGAGVVGRTGPDEVGMGCVAAVEVVVDRMALGGVGKGCAAAVAGTVPEADTGPAAADTDLPGASRRELVAGPGSVDTAVDIRMAVAAVARHTVDLGAGREVADLRSYTTCLAQCLGRNSKRSHSSMAIGRRQVLVGTG